MILQMHTHGRICSKANSTIGLMGMTYNSANLYVQLATEFRPSLINDTGGQIFS